MSFSEWSNKKKKKEEEKKESAKNQSFSSWSNAKYGVEDIAPVVTTKKDEGIAPVKERTWFDTSALDDGFQWSDVPKVIIGTATDIGENLGSGIIGIGEKLLDAGATLGAAMNRQNMMQAAESEMIYNTISGKGNGNVLQRYLDSQKKVEEDTAAFVAKDLYDEEAVAKQIITAPVKHLTGVDAETDSILGEKSDSLVQSAGQLGAQIGLNALVPGSGMVLMGATSFGSEAESAYMQGASFHEGLASATISAGAEVLTEKIGGISFGGKTLTDAVVSKFAKNATSKLANILVSTGKFTANAIAEGGEEILSGYLSAIGQQMTYMEDKEIEELFSDEEKLESFIGGFVLGGLGEADSIVKSAHNGVSYATELTKNEQAVVDKVYKDRVAEAEKDGKVTQKRKNEIYDKVLEDMDKGYIHTDTIEEVLGGDSYKTYKDASAKEEAVLKELESLYEGEELAKRQQNIRDNSTLSELKGKLGQTVSEMVKNDRLSESYNERSRRRQKYEADLSGYDEKQRKVVQKAIDSGVLNNTNRSHELVDLIAKIGGDKDLDFDFTNNEKLKESGFALDGVTVNGFVNENGVTVNVNSAKALNSVVGHEITHVLEDTEVYTELEKALTEHAKGKNEYDTRLKKLVALYENVDGYKGAEGYGKIKKELIADLAGDYLFTDKEFVNRLSTEHRNVFQKIFDEVKYLCRVATAGSKEARELERVKKVFEEVYRTETKNPTEDGGVRYSLSKNAKTELHKALYDTKYRDDVRLRDITPAIMLGHNGVENLPMAMKASHIRENVFTEDEARKLGLRVDDDTHYHGLGEDLFLQVIDGLDNVKEAYRGTRNAADPTRREDYFLLVSEFKDKDGNTINVPVYINRHAQVNRVFVDVNKISTVYGKEALRDYIMRQVKNRNLVRIKRKSIESSERAAPMAAGYRNDASTDSIRNPNADVNNKNSLSEKAQTDTDGLFPLSWQVKGKDVALEGLAPMAISKKETTTKAPMAGDTQRTAAATQTRQEVILPTPEDIAKMEAEREAGRIPLPEDIALMEQRQLDAEYRQRMGGDPTLYDTDEDEGVETTRDKLEVKRKNQQWELQENQQLKESTMQAFDRQIEELQAKYDAKENKVSKDSQALLRRIQRLKRQKSDRAAEYDSRISQIQNRIGKLDERLQTGTPEKTDRLEKIYKRIDAQMEYDERELTQEFNRKRNILNEEIKDRGKWIRTKAADLELEMGHWIKGTSKASPVLKMMRSEGYEWRDIMGAASAVKNDPNQITGKSTPAEMALRELLGREYDEKAYELEKLETQYQQGVEALRKKAQEQKKKSTTAYMRKEANARYMLEIAKIVGDISKWVDKNLGVSYKTNTLRRNLRDVVKGPDGKPDYAKADAIYDYLMGQYNHNEAILKKMLNALFDKYRKMDINAVENTYIQMLGEYLQGSNDGVKTNVTEEMLAEYRKEHGNKIDEEKCREVVHMARQDYDMLFDRANEVLRAHGMEELKYVQGYFPHIKKIKQNWIQRVLNITPVEKKNKSTQSAGRSGTFKPNKKSLRYSKERQGPETDFNFLKGYEQYAAEILDWIYHIPDIQRRRAFENYIRITHAEKNTELANKVKAIRNSDVYNADEEQIALDQAFQKLDNPLGNFVTDLMIGTNTLAGKKTGGDRTVEEFLNPDSAKVINQMSSRVSANLVAGSISAGLSNLVPIQQSWAQVSPLSSVRSFGAAFRNSFMDRDDGVIEKSDFLTNRLRNPDKLYKKKWDKIGDVVSWWGSMMDSFSSQTVWRSKYMENIKAGMTETEAIKNADQFAENILAGRSRGNLPTLFESRNFIAKAFTTCQLEVANQYGYWLKDLPQDMQDEARGKLVAGYMKTFIGAAMLNGLLFKPITGRDATTDPIGMIAQLLMGLLDEDEESEDAILDFAENVLQEVPFVGGLLGGGRVPISSAMPYDGVWGAVEGITRDVASGDWKSLAEELSNPVFYMVPPMGGGQLRKTWQGLGMYLFNEEPGSYTSGGRLRYPVSTNVFSVGQKALFGKWSGQNAQQYIEEGRSPLSINQTQELKDTGMSIQEYWSYRDGLRDLSTLAEKADYIDSLDLTDEQKNILINNIAERKEDIDMSDYSDYGSFEEFDFASKNPEKYSFLQENNVSYEEYKGFDEDAKDAYDWAFNNPEKFTLSKAVASDVVTYRKYTSDLFDIKADKDESGKSISGSRKEKVIDYINNMDADYGEKIILFKSLYESEDTYNYDIVEYLNEREDISYEEMVTILKELGFTVSSDGTVSW